MWQACSECWAGSRNSVYPWTTVSIPRLLSGNIRQVSVIITKHSGQPHAFSGQYTLEASSEFPICPVEVVFLWSGVTIIDYNNYFVHVVICDEHIHVVGGPVEILHSITSNVYFSFWIFIIGSQVANKVLRAFAIRGRLSCNIIPTRLFVTSRLVLFPCVIICCCSMWHRVTLLMPSHSPLHQPFCSCSVVCLSFFTRLVLQFFLPNTFPFYLMSVRVPYMCVHHMCLSPVWLYISVVSQCLSLPCFPKPSSALD